MVRISFGSLLGIILMSAIGGVLFIALTAKMPEMKHPVPAPYVPQKITVNLADGQKMFPVRLYASQESVQVVTKDGEAITMAWRQIDSISHR